MAKSLLCVQKMEKSPALPRLTGLLTSSVTIPTAKNTMVLATRMASRNVQFTELPARGDTVRSWRKRERLDTHLRSSSARDRKIRDGRAKVPTNVFSPLASVCEIKLNRPARYLEK